MLSDELIKCVESYGVKRRKTLKPSWTHKVVTVVKLVVQFLVQEVRYKLEVSRDNARDTDNLSLLLENRRNVRASQPTFMTVEARCLKY